MGIRWGLLGPKGPQNPHQIPIPTLPGVRGPIRIGCGFWVVNLIRERPEQAIAIRSLLSDQKRDSSCTSYGTEK